MAKTKTKGRNFWLKVSYFMLPICHVFVAFFSNNGSVFTRDSRMLRASWPWPGRLSVRPSVCLSVTLLYCIETVQARITKSSLFAASRTLVLCNKISCPSVRRFPSNKDVKKGYLKPPKLGIFVNFSWFRVATHILRVNCAEIDRIRPRQLVYEIFSIKRKF